MTYLRPGCPGATPPKADVTLPHAKGSSWIGFLNACPTEALIIVHGQVFKKAQGRKPREKDAGVKCGECLWGLKRRARSLSGRDVCQRRAGVGHPERSRGDHTVIEVPQRSDSAILSARRQSPRVAGA